MKPFALALSAVAVASAGCSSGEAEPGCPAVSDPVVSERIVTVVRDVAEHRTRAIINAAEGSAPLVLSDDAVQVSPDAAKTAERAYNVLSWSNAEAGYVRYEINNVKVNSVSACENTVVAEATATTRLYHRAGGFTGSVFGPVEFEFDTAGGRWTLKGHRLLGVVKQRPMVEPTDWEYEKFDNR
ncbi:hypothetical protein AB0M48_09870 [Lentzea sp. NPDC051208]|uniref:hypothetical protein n=1 Tax=Lentzea sp. NPDC051208 TaxID=3154642 RepID=UPI0034359E36